LTICTRIIDGRNEIDPRADQKPATFIVEYVQHLADDLNGKFGHLIDDVQVLIDKNLAYFGTKKK
jgi:hypothetical protein